MEISREEYRNNLLFYTILKNLIKCRLTEHKMMDLITLIETNTQLSFKQLLTMLSNNIVNPNVQSYEDYITLLNLCNEDNFMMWRDLILLASELLLTKNLILEESKNYARIQYREEINKTKDQLSFAYDMANLELPYGQRVISSLLVYTLTDLNRDTEFVLPESGKTILSISNKVQGCAKKYGINTNNIFMIIMDELNNQSIISTAGNSYEARVESVLRNISANVQIHVHDKNIPSVEYDFAFEFAGKLYGVNAKRTLRERYKQNFEDVNNLSVDGMFFYLRNRFKSRKIEQYYVAQRIFYSYC